MNKSIFAMALLLMAGVAGVIVATDGASAADLSATATVTFSDNEIATSKETTATIAFKELDTEDFVSVSWSAKLVNSSGTSQSSALSKTSGSSSNAEDSWEITVTAPSTAGTYTLQVTFTEKAKVEGSTTTLDSITREATLHVAEPITLSVTVSNSGSLAISDASVYFYVDGKKIEDSKTTLTVGADSSATVTYKYFDKDLSSGKHTFYLASADGSYIEGLDTSGTHSFYYKQSSQDYMTYIMIVIMIIVLISLIVVLRKPVKNYGKPKSRR